MKLSVPTALLCAATALAAAAPANLGAMVRRPGHLPSITSSDRVLLVIF